MPEAVCIFAIEETINALFDCEEATVPFSASAPNVVFLLIISGVPA